MLLIKEVSPRDSGLLVVEQRDYLAHYNKVLAS